MGCAVGQPARLLRRKSLLQRSSPPNWPAANNAPNRSRLDTKIRTGIAIGIPPKYLSADYPSLNDV
jgi:hypothetical protein